MATALFFKDGKIAMRNFGFLNDSDHEIKPNATEMLEINAFNEFDDVQIYLTARGE